MEPLDFNNITSVNNSEKEFKEENDQIFIYLKDEGSDDIPQENTSRDAFREMIEKMKQLSENASYIIKNKKFSHKTLFQKYSNIKYIKSEEDSEIIKSKPINEIEQINKNYINTNNIILKDNNIKLSKHDINPINNTKINIYSDKDERFLENKRKRLNSIHENKDDTKKLFNDILDISQKISNLNNDVIKLNAEPSESCEDSENIEAIINCSNDELATIYLNENIVQKIIIAKSNKIITEEKEISVHLKKIKSYLNAMLNKLNKQSNNF